MNDPATPSGCAQCVELFAIGNELLVGQVLDTNTHWLVRSITGLGARVRRAHIVRDEYDEIADALGGAIRRAPRLIITTGGLGPTEDDLTYRAIARMLGLPLEENAEALDMVRRRYEHLAAIRPNFSAELNEARRKMALFPPGALPLANPNGAAPGLALDLNGRTTLISLPGVPSEMKEMYATSVQPVLARTIGAGGYVEHTIVLDRGDESRIAALLQAVQAAHPAVYVKSRGQTLQDGPHLTVVLSAGGEDLAGIQLEVGRTEHDAVEGLAGLGYGVLRVEG
jgi:molybdenum cofactor synthesis domain-containing protein